MQDLKFGSFTIDAKEQIAQTEHSFAFVNLKPLVQGGTGMCPSHVSCCPFCFKHDYLIESCSSLLQGMSSLAQNESLRAFQCFRQRKWPTFGTSLIQKSTLCIVVMKKGKL